MSFTGQGEGQVALLFNRKGQDRQDDGYLMLAVLFMLVILVLTLSIAAPTVATDLRRDKELETIHRGNQYVRAVRLYFRKYGRYPNTIDQLVSSDNVRYLRKRYLDPMTGKDDWKLLHLGEVQMQNAGGNIPGSTPANMMPGASSIGGSSTGTGTGSSSSGFGSSGYGSSSGFGSSSSFGSSSGFGSSSSFGSTSSSFGSSPSSGSSPGSSPFGSGTSTSPTGTDNSGTNGSGTTGSGTPGSGTTGTGSSAFGTPGSTFGGAPIVGVGLPADKASIKVYKKQTRYNKWQFVYDPSQDLAGAMGNMVAPGSTPNGIGGTTPGTTQDGTSPFGGTSGSGSGFGSSGSGFGSSGSGFGNSGFSNGNGMGGTPTSPSGPGTSPSPNSPQ